MTIKKKNQEKKLILPFVSVCTPTFNRRPFIENMFNCFRNQTYPKHRIEWIIVDDGTDKIRDLVEKSGITQIRYFEVDKKMSLGEKRNYMHSFVRGSIIVYMDDDDYYPPERIEDAVDKLTANPKALCAGSSEIYIYFKHIKKMYKCGPYNSNHATAGTFAFRKELLDITKYEDHAAVAEERAFLKDYTIPFVQLDPMKAILVFSHNHNTFDKRKMLDNPHPDYFRECDKTVDMFITKKSEINIYNFFMNDIDDLLAKYEPGEPKMKPDVLKQIKEIEDKREQMIKEEMEKKGGGGPIMLQQHGKPPMALSSQDVVNIIQQQQQQLQDFQQKIEENNKIVLTLQKQLVEKTKIIRDFSENGKITITESNTENVSKLENMIIVLQKQLIEKTKTIRELQSSQNNDKKDTNNNIGNNELQIMITMLQKQLIEKTKTIRELQNSQNNDKKDTNNNELQIMITMLQKQLIEKTKTIRELQNQTNKKELQDMIEKLEEQLIEKDKEMIKIEEQLKKLEEILTEKNKEIEGKSQKQVDNESNIELGEKIKNLKQQLIEKEKEIEEKNEKNEKNEKKISYLKNLVSNLQVSIAEKNAELQQIINLINNNNSVKRLPIEVEDNIVNTSKNDIEMKSKSDPEIKVDIGE